MDRCARDRSHHLRVLSEMHLDSQPRQRLKLRIFFARVSGRESLVNGLWLFLSRCCPAAVPLGVPLAVPLGVPKNRVSVIVHNAIDCPARCPAHRPDHRLAREPLEKTGYAGLRPPPALSTGPHGEHDLTALEALAGVFVLGVLSELANVEPRVPTVRRVACGRSEWVVEAVQFSPERNEAAAHKSAPAPRGRGGAPNLNREKKEGPQQSGGRVAREVMSELSFVCRALLLCILRFGDGQGQAFVLAVDLLLGHSHSSIERASTSRIFRYSFAPIKISVSFG